MPTQHKRETIIFTAEESESLRREAKEKGLSLSNLVRKKLRFKPFQIGATKGNKRNPFGRAGKKEEA